MTPVAVGLWQDLQQIATIAPLGTFIVAVVAVVAFLQKSLAGRRQAWWSRPKWAIDRALATDDQAPEAGLIAIEVLRSAKSPGRNDVALLRAVALSVQDEIVDETAAVVDNDKKEAGGNRGSKAE